MYTFNGPLNHSEVEILSYNGSWAPQLNEYTGGNMVNNVAKITKSKAFDEIMTKRDQRGFSLVFGTFSTGTLCSTTPCCVANANGRICTSEERLFHCRP